MSIDKFAARLDLPKDIDNQVPDLTAAERYDLKEIEKENDLREWNKNIPKPSEKSFQEMADEEVLCPEALKVLSESPAAREALEHMHNHNMPTYYHMVNLVNLVARGISQNKEAGADMSEEDKLLLEAAATHDCGKEWIDTRILDKPGALTLDEEAEMKKHAVFSGLILESKAPVLADIAVLHHAPGGQWSQLSEEERAEINQNFAGLETRVKENPLIEKIARKTALADQIEALFAERPYKSGKYVNEVREIMQGSGAHKEDKSYIDLLIENWRDCLVNKK